MMYNISESNKFQRKPKDIPIVKRKQTGRIEDHHVLKDRKVTKQFRPYNLFGGCLHRVHVQPQKLGCKSL